MNIEQEIEKYRNENQMDYVKAIELLHTYRGDSEVFKTIYKITRLHIPKVVYKYMALNEDDNLNKLKFNSLSEHKIFLASPKRLNDPFEANAFFYRKESLAKIERLKRWEGRIIDDFGGYILLTSFTSLGVNSMPMWAHYTNNHSGFCVAYDTTISENIQLQGTIMRVQYVKERIDVTAIVEQHIRELENLINERISKGNKVIVSDNLIMVFIITFLSCLKHDSWSYENELRCIIGSNAKGAPYIVGKPQSIYVGKNCTKENKKILVDIAKVSGIPIYEMEFEEYTTNYEYKSSLITEKF
jgi:hypothetical protein